MGQRLRKKKKRKKKPSRVSSTWANIDANIPTVSNTKTKTPKKRAAKIIMSSQKKKKKKKKMQTIPRGVGIHIHVRFIACYWSLLKKIKK
jgi:hypothetical protein